MYFCKKLLLVFVWTGESNEFEIKKDKEPSSINF